MRLAQSIAVSSIEILRVIHFRPDRSVLAISQYSGTTTRIVIPIRTIIGDALTLGSAGLLLSHNHPSGDPTPSRADIAATRLLARTAATLDICLHDHVVTGSAGHISFRAAGLL